MILGVILLLVLLLGLVRVGAVVTFGEGVRARVRVGPVWLTVYPRKPKKPKQPKAEKPAESQPEKPQQGKIRSIPKLTFDELWELLDVALTALRATVRRACSRMLIDPLDVTVVFGGWNPADVAMMFGRANTLMYELMPRLEETFCIPDPSLHLRIDYDQDWPSAKGTLGVSLRVCDLFAIGLTLLVPMGKWYLRFKKAHRGEVTAHKVPAEKTEPETQTTVTNDTKEIA